MNLLLLFKGIKMGSRWMMSTLSHSFQKPSFSEITDPEPVLSGYWNRINRCVWEGIHTCLYAQIVCARVKIAGAKSREAERDESCVWASSVVWLMNGAERRTGCLILPPF